MGHPVVHFEVLGKDTDALVKFYGEAFGWSIDTDNPVGYGVVDTQAGGKGIAGGVGTAQEGGVGWVTFYVEVPDLDGAMQKVELLGGTTLAGPMEVPGGPRLALFSDPEGHTVGLVEGTREGAD
jgi:predicted enzyme related to lactoylglutathione lyase